MGLIKVLTKIWSKLGPIWPLAKIVTRPDFSNSSKEVVLVKKLACFLVIILDCRQCHNKPRVGKNLIISLIFLYTLSSLFVFSIFGLKQNSGSLLTLASDTGFFIFFHLAVPFNKLFYVMGS